MLAQVARTKELEGQLMDAEDVRRKLHNMVQELRGNVRVFTRIRPGGDDAQPTIAPQDDSVSVTLTVPNADKTNAMGVRASSSRTHATPLSNQSQRGLDGIHGVENHAPRVACHHHLDARGKTTPHPALP